VRHLRRRRDRFYKRECVVNFSQPRHDLFWWVALANHCTLHLKLPLARSNSLILSVYQISGGPIWAMTRGLSMPKSFCEIFFVASPRNQAANRHCEQGSRMLRNWLSGRPKVGDKSPSTSSMGSNLRSGWDLLTRKFEDPALFISRNRTL